MQPGGGGGPKRTPALAARFASEFNLAFPALDFVPLQFGRVRAALEAAGRAADEIVYSAAFVVCAGEDEAQLTRRAAAIGRYLDEMRANSPLAGTPGEIIERLTAFADAGVQRVYLQFWTFPTLRTWSFSPPRSCRTTGFTRAKPDRRRQTPIAHTLPGFPGLLVT